MNNTNATPLKATFINSFDDSNYAKWDGIQGTIERLIVNPVDDNHTNIVDPINMPIIELRMPCGALVHAYADDIDTNEHPTEITAFLNGMNTYKNNMNDELANEDEVSLMEIASKFMPHDLAETNSDFFAYGFAVGSHKFS